MRRGTARTGRRIVAAALLATASFWAPTWSQGGSDGGPDTRPNGGPNGGPQDASRVSPSDPPVAASDLRVDEAQLERGRDAYDFHCTTCHGATGAGFAEARAAFPADHYDCARCHGPGNPAVMTRRQIESTQTVFSLGHAPALDGTSAIDRFGDAEALLGYVQASMPRWDPGRLDDEAYLDVTVYLLHLAYGADSGGDALSAEDLRRVRLDELR